MKSFRLFGAAMILASAFSFGLAQQDITLTWWINPWRIAPPGFPEGETLTGEEFPRYISEQFMELHPNVTVEFEMVPNAGFAEKINTALFAGNPPDVMKDLDFNPEWAREGLLEPIDDYLTEEDRADFIDYTLEAGKIGDHYYVWPWNNSNNGMGSTLLLNPALFEEAGVDLPAEPNRQWTIDEFLEVAQQLTRDTDGDGQTDVYAITLAAQDEINVLGWLHRFGARLLNEDNTAFALNSPEGVRALQLMVDMIHEYEIAPEGAEALGVYDTIDNFHQGRAAMGYGGIYEIGRIDRYLNEDRIEEAINVIIAPFPHDPETGPVAYQTSGGFVVFDQDDDYKRDMAMELARFITNHENIQLLENLLYVTARKSANEELTFESVQAYTDVQPQVETYVNAISHGVPYYGPPQINTAPAMDFLTAAVQAALTLQKTPQEALDEFVLQADRVVFNRTMR